MTRKLRQNAEKLRSKREKRDTDQPAGAAVSPKDTSKDNASRDDAEPTKLRDDWQTSIHHLFHKTSRAPGRRGRLMAATAQVDEALLTIPQIVARLGAREEDEEAVRDALFHLVMEGRLLMVVGERFARAAGRDEVIGRLRLRPSGKAFVALTEPIEVDDEPVRDVMVRAEDRGASFGGDLVRVHLLRMQKDRVLGAVTQVLERAAEFVVGQFSGDTHGARLIPRGTRIDREVVLAMSEVRRALDGRSLKNGDWVVAKVNKWTSAPRPLEGTLAEIIGDYNDSGTDVTILLRQHGCAEAFPPDVEAEAEAIKEAVPSGEIKRRRDLRDLLTFTIDGADSKDFDDAISIERLGRDRWRLGVHIADVSFFVRQGAPLDRDALERSTSIYPLDRVVPMLPERLSNDLCSLRPREDRLAMSCMMEVDREGEVTDYELFESVIHSDHRLTYDQVQAVFDAADKDDDVNDLAIEDSMGQRLPVAAILEARGLARHLVSMKQRRGALDLDVPEPVVRLDRDGRVLDVTYRQRHESHRLIEEFMTLANEVVGRHMRHHHLPALFRVHDVPDPGAIERIAPVLRGLSLPISLKTEWGPTQIQALLARTEQMEAGHILRGLVLRTMQRAIYQPENIGHFGLGSECYLHFTSPIRRYPDLIVHRILRESLAKGGLPRDRRDYYVETLPSMGSHCSEKERDAQRIEWDVEKLKGLEFMATRLGEEYEGYVSGCGQRGAFIQIAPHPVEGMLTMKSLPGWWRFDEETMVLVEENTGRRLRIGDKVQVMVERVDPLGLQMDLRLIEGGRVVGDAPAEYREKGKRGAARGAAKKGGKPGAAPAKGSKGGARKKQKPRPFSKFR
jgi:ribonuclease R